MAEEAERVQKLKEKYNQLKQANATLKKGFLDKQEECGRLEQQLKEKEITIRQQLEEIDQLQFQNGRMSKQLGTLTAQVEEQRKSHTQSSWSMGGLISGKQEAIQKAENDLAVLRDELMMKIQENEELHMRVFEAQKQHNEEAERLRDTEASRGRDLERYAAQLKASKEEVERLTGENRRMVERIGSLDHQFSASAQLSQSLRDQMEKERLESAQAKQALQLRFARWVPFDWTQHDLWTGFSLSSQQGRFMKQREEALQELGAAAHEACSMSSGALMMWPKAFGGGDEESATRIRIRGKVAELAEKLAERVKEAAPAMAKMLGETGLSLGTEQRKDLKRLSNELLLIHRRWVLYQSLLLLHDWHSAFAGRSSQEEALAQSFVDCLWRLHRCVRTLVSRLRALAGFRGVATFLPDLSAENTSAAHFHLARRKLGRKGGAALAEDKPPGAEASQRLGLVRRSLADVSQCWRALGRCLSSWAAAQSGTGGATGTAVSQESGSVVGLLGCIHGLCACLTERLLPTVERLATQVPGPHEMPLLLRFGRVKSQAGPDGTVILKRLEVRHGIASPLGALATQRLMEEEKCRANGGLVWISLWAGTEKWAQAVSRNRKFRFQKIAMRPCERPPYGAHNSQEYDEKHGRWWWQKKADGIADEVWRPKLYTTIGKHARSPKLSRTIVRWWREHPATLERPAGARDVVLQKASLSAFRDLDIRRRFIKDNSTFDSLVKQASWRQAKVVVRDPNTGELSLRYNEKGQSVSAGRMVADYSGGIDFLDKILQQVFSKMDIRDPQARIFMNFYADGKDKISPHRHDFWTCLLSFGSERILTVDNRPVLLRDGDLIVFGTQNHGVPSMPDIKDGRISLVIFFYPDADNLERQWQTINQEEGDDEEKSVVADARMLTSGMDKGFKASLLWGQTKVEQTMPCDCGAQDAAHALSQALDPTLAKRQLLSSPNSGLKFDGPKPVEVVSELTIFSAATGGHSGYGEERVEEKDFFKGLTDNGIATLWDLRFPLPREGDWSEVPLLRRGCAARSIAYRSYPLGRREAGGLQGHLRSEEGQEVLRRFLEAAREKGPAAYAVAQQEDKPGSARAEVAELLLSGAFGGVRVMHILPGAVVQSAKVSAPAPVSAPKAISSPACEVAAAGSPNVTAEHPAKAETGDEPRRRNRWGKSKERVSQSLTAAQQTVAEGYKATKELVGGKDTKDDKAEDAGLQEKIAQGLATAKEKAAEGYDAAMTTEDPGLQEKIEQGVATAQEKVAEGYDAAMTTEDPGLQEKIEQGVATAQEKAAEGYDAAMTTEDPGLQEKIEQGVATAQEKVAEGYDAAMTTEDPGLQEKIEQGLATAQEKVAEGYDAAMTTEDPGLQEKIEQGVATAQEKVSEGYDAAMTTEDPGLQEKIEQGVATAQEKDPGLQEKIEQGLGTAQEKAAEGYAKIEQGVATLQEKAAEGYDAAMTTEDPGLQEKIEQGLATAQEKAAAGYAAAKKKVQQVAEKPSDETQKQDPTFMDKVQGGLSGVKEKMVHGYEAFKHQLVGGQAEKPNVPDAKEKVKEGIEAAKQTGPVEATKALTGEKEEGKSGKGRFAYATGAKHLLESAPEVIGMEESRRVLALARRLGQNRAKLLQEMRQQAQRLQAGSNEKAQLSQELNALQDSHALLQSNYDVLKANAGAAPAEVDMPGSSNELLLSSRQRALRGLEVTAQESSGMRQHGFFVDVVNLDSEEASLAAGPPRPEVLDAWELAIRKVYEQHLCQLQKQVLIADSKAVRMGLQLQDFDDKMQRQEEEKQELIEKVVASQLELANVREDMDATRKNYDGQLGMLTEHICGLSARLSEKDAGLASLQANKMLCGRCGMWNSMGKLLSEPAGTCSTCKEKLLSRD
ncbi:unnamed protein product [Effrenium voratum]|uniref:Protein phosphatase 1 regulatory subunit 21 N-terminal domain-containing protein n=1 Tax=Effrenium voratum TaxID=2562239 RepID=A0AA36JRT2_9DINO|nr:unnamed protein product [Effrenium voratum]